MKKVWVELEGVEWDFYSGEIQKRGNFSKVTAHLEEYKKRDITTYIFLFLKEKN